MLRKNRKLNRLKNFNYSKNGYYFITICTHFFVPFFGVVKNNKMVLNECGGIAEKYWLNIPKHFKCVYLDDFIVMPNHIHGIIIIKRNISVGDADLRPLRQPLHRNKMLLPKIIHQFKSSFTRKIKKTTSLPFKWQRSYHDRIIRNKHELNRIRQYIKNNPNK